jgi:hypothetical protein
MLNPKKISNFNNNHIITQFNQSNYHTICDKLAAIDADLASIILKKKKIKCHFEHCEKSIHLLYERMYRFLLVPRSK